MSHEQSAGRNVPARKPYERPMLVDFGSIARGHGAACNAGSSATTTCQSGGSVSPVSCTTGFLAFWQACRSGNAAAVRCRAGTQGPAW